MHRPSRADLIVIIYQSGQCASRIGLQGRTTAGPNLGALRLRPGWAALQGLEECHLLRFDDLTNQGVKRIKPVVTAVTGGAIIRLGVAHARQKAVEGKII